MSLAMDVQCFDSIFFFDLGQEGRGEMSMTRQMRYNLIHTYLIVYCRMDLPKKDETGLC